MISRGLMSSDVQTYGTPMCMFEALDAEFEFAVDVCADETNYKMRPYISQEQDGLRADWSQYGPSVFMNPPYGRDISRWVKKAYEFGMSGGTAVCLLPMRSGSKWFMDYVMKAAEWRIIRGRVKFEGSMGSAPFPSVIVIFSMHTDPLKIVEWKG